MIPGLAGAPGFEGFAFATPVLLFLLPAVAVLALPGLLRRRSATVIADGTLARAAARPTWRLRLRWLPGALRAIAIALLIVAIARPRHGNAVTVAPEEGVDVVLSVDVSSSMTQLAVPRVTRLTAAQQAVAEFADRLDGGRIGLVAFQSRAITLSPLTADHNALKQRAKTLEPGLVEDGTAIGLGLAEALTLLGDSPARSRVVVLLSDGENNAGNVEPADAARVAQALGIRVYTVAFAGTTGAASGLRAMAITTGAQSYDARTPDELKKIYADIGNLERSRLGERKFLDFTEYGPWLAGVAVLALLSEGALRATWLRRAP